jgi:hypothetical protein
MYLPARASSPRHLFEPCLACNGACLLTCVCVAIVLVQLLLPGHRANDIDTRVWYVCMYVLEKIDMQGI